MLSPPIGLSKMAKTTKPTKKSLAPTPEIDKFLGKSYVLDRSENYEEFLMELGVKKYVRQKAIKSKPTIVLTRQKHHYVLSTSYPEGWNINVKFKPGEEINRCGGFMRQTSSVFHIAGSKLIEEQNTDLKKLLIQREFKRKELFVTMEVTDIICFRWFKLFEPSNHSINTETSRRSFLWESSRNEDSHNSKQEIQKRKHSDSETEEENVCY